MKRTKYQCTKFNYRADLSLPSFLSSMLSRLTNMWYLSFLLMKIMILTDAQTEELSWKKRIGKLRAEALENIFPGVRDYAEEVDRFALGFVNYLDPLETISFITLYLPGIVFAWGFLFLSVPHVLNFLILLPKLWFFGLPCLYQFKHSIVRKRRGILTARLNGDEVTREPCEALNLAHITRQVYNSLLKMATIEA